jgi:hypothetical protein
VKSLVRQTLHGSANKLIGNNIGIWRQQLESINGFDERYRGWGCEDDDLAIRLRQNQQRFKTILGRTHAYHLWHPRHETRTDKWRDGCNVKYLQRPILLTACLQGLRSIPFSDLSVRVLFGHSHATIGHRLESYFHGTQLRCPDLEVVFWPADQHFGTAARHRILVTDQDVRPPRTLSKLADAHIQLPAPNVIADPDDLAHACISQKSLPNPPASDWLLDELASLVGAPRPDTVTGTGVTKPIFHRCKEMRIAS